MRASKLELNLASKLEINLASKLELNLASKLELNLARRTLDARIKACVCVCGARLFDATIVGCAIPILTPPTQAWDQAPPTYPLMHLHAPILSSLNT